MKDTTNPSTEYIYYLNGDYVPVSDAKVSVLDSVCHGDSVFDTMRTVNKTRVFRIDDHLERLYSSCKAADIDPGMGPGEMKQIVMEVVNRNRHLLADNEDAWILPRISSGSLRVSKGPATVMVLFVPLPYRSHAASFKTGAHLIVPTVRQVPPQCMDPKIKHDSRLFMHIAEREAKRIDPHCGTLLLDIHGNVAELTDASFFIVKDGDVITPPSQYVLPGVSRKMVLELCAKLEIPAYEKDIQLFDVYNADEAFRTGTSYRMLPVSRINLRHLWKEIPGPVTRRLLDAYKEEMGLDFVAQYMNHLKDEEIERLEKQSATV
jgi:branched-chain amino acid aminotransferase